ncbi:MutT family pyrophosphate-releasing NTPase [Scardovia inopinata]|uniref:Nudix hydrolase domain-containing protein n=1 Tax=Scardovia inopinata F0304 TaxID=641146 RepID=W5IHS6_SCAIO|nr:NUDIX hydrolase [Scardovia inopinata]EFG26416.1 hypothetical protein HMPREF9020_00035 [Scardovia inopinata F0304]BAR07457.1 putative hydrolase [Scardovia inopinata JCM 12537]SUV51530.1 MutT family pyrophosphate-releasing NTPase [Scardovia inopinata]
MAPDLTPAGRSRILRQDRLFTGRIFAVDRITVELQGVEQEPVQIERDLIRHAPVAVMLVHDCIHDRYYLQYEYRIGAQAIVPGIPAGFIDQGESPEQAMLREIKEETGIVPNQTDGSYSIDHVGKFYSSEGMSNELASIAVIHLHNWHQEAQHLDQGEFITGGWVSWDQLLAAHISASNSIIAIQHEALRRLKKEKHNSHQA